MLLQMECDDEIGHNRSATTAGDAIGKGYWIPAIWRFLNISLFFKDFSQNLVVEEYS